MAYLRPITVTECQRCGKRATHTLYDKQDRKLGDYCKPCGDIMRLDALSDEYYDR